jgi:hypothetical protein
MDELEKQVRKALSEGNGQNSDSGGGCCGAIIVIFILYVMFQSC